MVEGARAAEEFAVAVARAGDVEVGSGLSAIGTSVLK